MSAEIHASGMGSHLVFLRAGTDPYRGRVVAQAIGRLHAVVEPGEYTVTSMGFLPFTLTVTPSMTSASVSPGTSYFHGPQNFEASFQHAHDGAPMSSFRPSGVFDPLDPIGSVLGYPVWPSPGVWGTAGRQVSTNPAPVIPPPGPMGTGQAPAVTPTPGAPAPAPVAAAPVAPSTSWWPLLLGGAVVVGGGYLLTRKGRK